MTRRSTPIRLTGCRKPGLVLLVVSATLAGCAPAGSGDASVTIPSTWTTSSDCRSADRSAYDAGGRDSWAEYPREALRDAPGFTALPDDAFPIVVSSHGQDAIVGEQASGSVLRVRRVGADGATVWSTTLGRLHTTEYRSVATTGRTTPRYSSDFPRPVIESTNDLVRILWAEASERREEDAQLVVTVLDASGRLQSTRGLGALASNAEVTQWFFGLHPSGSVSVASRAGAWDETASLMIRRHSSTGELLWQAAHDSRGGTYTAVIVDGESTDVLANGRFRRFDARGASELDVDAPTTWSEVIPIAGEETAVKDGRPALLITVVPESSSMDAPWVCITDHQLRPLASTAEDFLWAPVRAWLGTSGLLVLGEMGALLHGESAQRLVSLDHRGATQRVVTVATAGGREVGPEVTVEDAAVTDDGTLVLVGSYADLRPGVDADIPDLDASQLETRHFLVRFPSPTGRGDLRGLPPS